MSAFSTIFGRMKNLLTSDMRDILLELSTGNSDRDFTVKKINVDSVVFDKAAAVEVVQGEMAWNIDEETFDFGMNGAVWQGGLENFQHVRNNTGSEISDGTPVMAVGTVGNSSRVLVAPMDGTDTDNAKLMVGIATYNLGTTAETKDGKVTWYGKVRGIDTTGTLSFGSAETWVDEEVLYVDPVNIGYLTNVSPSAPLLSMPVAFIIHSHSSGTMQVRITPIDEHAVSPYRFSYSDYVDVPVRNAEQNIHGDLTPLSTAHDLSAGDATVNGGVGKLVVVINAASDFVGDITFTGTSIDRDTGVETGSDTATVTIDTLSTDASAADANGITEHNITSAYITDRWFTGSVTISSADTAITDMDIYHISFDQVNDASIYRLDTLDYRTKCISGTGAEFSFYLYTVKVTGDKVNITALVSKVVSSYTSDTWEILRRADLAETLNGVNEGFFIDLALLGTNTFRDSGLRLWGTILEE